jgi:DHA2 family multidrug resistance protein
VSGQGTDAAWRPRANPWLIAFMVTLATFMEVLDTTIVNVSLPHIAGSMSVSYDDATWTLTSYLVANGIVVPISGWLGRLIGRRRYFLLCIAMFTACSFLCGIAASLPQLVLFRLMQGFFGGGMQPCQQSIVLDTFEPSQRGRAFSVVAIAIIFAPVIGPTLGGWITDHYTWRWIFLINVPVGVVAFLAVARLVEDPPWVARDRAHLGDVDAVGLGLIALGLGSLQFMLDRGEDYDWFGSPVIRLFGVLAGVGIVGAVAWLLLVEKPVVNLRALGDRNFAIGSVMIFGIGAVLYSSNVLIPLLVEAQFGYTALLTGELMVPGAVLMFALIPLVGRVVMPLVQTRFVIAFGFASLGASLVYAHGLAAQMSYWELTLMRAALTLGLAFLFVPNGTISYSTLPRSLTPDATALYAMFRNIAGSAGIALVAALVTEHTQMHRAYLAAHLTPFDPPYQELLWQNLHRLQESGWARGSAQDMALGLINRTLTQQAAILAYTDVFAIMAIAAFAVVPLTLLFRPGIAGGRAARRR